MLVRIITVMTGSRHTKLVHTMQNQLTFINRASSTTSSMEMIWVTNRKVACRHSTQVEVVIDQDVI